MNEKTFDYKGKTITIQEDSDPLNPREDDNICIIHVGMRHYSFGDENYNTLEDIEAARIEAEKQGDICLPLYAYCHGGVTISLSPYACRWDSGQAGFVQISRQKMLDEFNKKRFTKALKDRALSIAQAEVKMLDEYLNNTFYMFNVEGEVVGGFSSEEDALEEAKNIVDGMVAA